MALQEEMEKQGIWLFRYRSILPLIILFIGLGFYLRTEIYPETFFLKNTPQEFIYEVFCLLISLTGLAIRSYTVGFTPRNTSGRNVKGQLADTLNTSGIYSLVRHPLYLGNFFMWLGPALLTGNFLFVISFCMFYWIYYERIMFAEEQFLRRKFTDHYIDWAKKVPAFLPNFKNFKKPDLSFSWKKVLQKEKNGFAAVFVIFSFFDISGELIKNEFEFNYFFAVSAILAIIIYLVLKFLKKKTNILSEIGR